MKYEQDQINSNAYILNYISDFKIRRLNQIAPNSSNGAHFIKINVYPSIQKKSNSICQWINTNQVSVSHIANRLTYTVDTTKIRQFYATSA